MIGFRSSNTELLPHSPRIYPCHPAECSSAPKTSRSTHSKMKQIYSSYSFVSASGSLKLLFMHIILTSCLFGVSLERALDGFLWEEAAPPCLAEEVGKFPFLKPQNKISRLNFIMANWRWSLFRSAVQIKSQTALGPRGVWVTTP